METNGDNGGNLSRVKTGSRQFLKRAQFVQSRQISDSSNEERT